MYVSLSLRTEKFSSGFPERMSAYIRIRERNYVSFKLASSPCTPFLEHFASFDVLRIGKLLNAYFYDVGYSFKPSSVIFSDFYPSSPVLLISCS